jgi:lysophospholipase L1-like esterase
MSRKLTRATIAVLSSAILLLLTLETGLRVLDPWRAGDAQEDILTMYSAFQPDPVRGYILPPGDYHMPRWSATVLADTTRLVPDDHANAPCKLVLLGDSLTFGMGVSDGETWANLLARELPQVDVVNTGVIRYDIKQILGTYRQFDDADAYLYLMYDNDWRDEHEWFVHIRPQRLSYIMLYLNLASDHGGPPGVLELDEFYEKLRYLLSDERVTIVALNSPFAQQVHAHVPELRIIPAYTQRISTADFHPDAAGHRQIAASMLPIVREAVRKACTAIL